MTWSPVLNLKLSAEGMAVEVINERIIKALLKSKIIYSFELIYCHCQVSEITSLSMLSLIRPKNLLLARLAKSLVLRKFLCFYQEIYFSFLPMVHVSFRKM